MLGLAILFGVAIGFALGLTGGGGGIFAVPLLVYGLHLAPREAVGVSLAAVGGTALSGVIPRWKLRQDRFSDWPIVCSVRYVRSTRGQLAFEAYSRTSLAPPL